MNYVFKLVLEFERLVVATINRVCVCRNNFFNSIVCAVKTHARACRPSTELYSKLAIMNCVI